MSGPAIPEIDPSQTDEQGRALSKPRPSSSSGQNAPTASPLSLDNVDDIISASGLGPHKNLSQGQFKMPELPGEAAPEAGAAGAGEAAAGAGAAEELLPLIALA